MKSKLVKTAIAAALAVTSFAAFAASSDCCTGIDCCLRMLADCC